MKVLHYIQSLNDRFSSASKFVSMLKDTMPPLVETMVISGKPSYGEFVKTLKTFNPDIVHIHTCWSHNAALVQLWSQRRGYDVIISPHGALMPNVIQTEFVKQKLPRIALYQFRAITKSTLIIASTKKELQALKELGWRKRIAFIRNPYVADDTATTTEAVIESLKVLYQKVIDTASRLNLTEKEEDYFRMMLHAGTMKDNGISINNSPEAQDIYTPEMQEELQKLSAHEWNTLLLAAYDRGVLTTIQRGAESLHLPIPQTELVIPARFQPKLTIKIRVNNKAANKLKKDFPDGGIEEKLALCISRLERRLVRKECESDKYRTWDEMTTLYGMLRHDDYDEWQFSAMINRLGLTRFTRRVMAILSETHMLTRGFMPAKPLNDRTTKKLLNQIYHQQ